MNIRERHFGRIGQPGQGKDEWIVDAGAVVRRLLLFEDYIMESNMLKELPTLARVFGVDGLLTLIKSPHFRILCDAQTTGQVGQIGFLKSSIARGGSLPLGSYRFVSVQLAEVSNYHHRALQSIHQIPGLPLKQATKLKDELAPRLITYPVEAGTEGVEDFRRELRSGHPIMASAIARALRTEAGIDALPCDVEIRVKDLGSEGDFCVDSNITTKFSLDMAVAHKIIEKALLGVAGLDQRLHQMRTLKAVTGFQDDEVSLFEAKLTFLVQQLDPTAQERRFDRIIAIGKLPSLKELPETRHIDIERVLELRETQECRDFREWLRQVSDETDKDIEDRFRSLHEKAAAITHTKTGKVIRFLVTNGAGMIPGAGLIAGPAAALGDSFIVEHLIGHPGPISFLGHQYRSIFQE
jgi:hypothetical protein